MLSVADAGEMPGDLFCAPIAQIVQDKYGPFPQRKRMLDDVGEFIEQGLKQRMLFRFDG